jgi:glycosyltransferase involved in cell wall biosynthesis
LKLALPRLEIGQALEEFRPDIIHVVNPAVLGLAGLFYGKVMQIPIVASYHTHLPQYLQHYGLGMLEGLLWNCSRRVQSGGSESVYVECDDAGIKRSWH